MLYERFIEECYEFGNGYLGEKDIPCIYGEGINWEYENTFHMNLGCKDGSEIKVTMDEKDERIWLMVIKNEVVSGEYKHTRFLDKYFNNPKEMITYIKEQVLLHQGYDINYTDNFEE